MRGRGRERERERERERVVNVVVLSRFANFSKFLCPFTHTGDKT